MRLSTFSDYCLRVLMYLGERTDRLSTIGEIARAHAISEHHLTKVAHQLGRGGYVETVRGKGGGMRLARAPREIVLGEVLRQTETDFALVECFGGDSHCFMEGACQLQAVLGEALAAMFRVLDGYSLADLLHRPDGSTRVLGFLPGAARDSRVE